VCTGSVGEVEDSAIIRVSETRPIEPAQMIHETHDADLQSHLECVQRPSNDSLDTLVAHDADEFSKLIVADG
jgi:hypothetical protein